MRVEYTDLSGRGRAGEYDLRTKTVFIHQGMTYRKERSTMAHELAHAFYGDEHGHLERLNAKMERRADEWAAHFLITPDAYRLAEAKFGTHTAWIAQELNVLERTVRAYARTLHRIGSDIYVNPKMGAGQWQMKIDGYTRQDQRGRGVG